MRHNSSRVGFATRTLAALSGLAASAAAQPPTPSQPPPAPAPAAAPAAPPGARGSEPIDFSPRGTVIVQDWRGGRPRAATRAEIEHWNGLPTDRGPEDDAAERNAAAAEEAAAAAERARAEEEASREHRARAWGYADGGSGNAEGPAPSWSPAHAYVPPPSTGPVGGYSWSTPAKAPRAAAPQKPSGLTVSRPGLEMLPDGRSRFSVVLSQAAQVAAAPAKGTLTFVVHHARLARPVDGTPLSMGFFDTPIAQARLVPAGPDIRVVLDLRAETKPAWRVEEADGQRRLVVDFPKATGATK